MKRWQLSAAVPAVARKAQEMMGKPANIKKKTSVLTILCKMYNIYI